MKDQFEIKMHYIFLQGLELFQNLFEKFPNSEQNYYLINHPKLRKIDIERFVRYIYTAEEKQFEEDIVFSYVTACYFGVKDLQSKLEAKINE